MAEFQTCSSPPLELVAKTRLIFDLPSIRYICGGSKAHNCSHFVSISCFCWKGKKPTYR